ncbi:MAG TPA: tRNA uridine-5-carboxymethylaminomethyl(34) synthesis GTPase MnmE, partial [Campylobacteraceae bacterium]|nr:tRNA uridine-5-carboxymethylaminomethyl(34) synthesis GTPase MnmE [Campylobacteraceae bacterium]
MEETICATATPHGTGGISVVRLSGPGALDIAGKIAPSFKGKPRYAQLVSLYDSDGSPIDEAIMLYFQAPKSFTGEDVVEFQSHGGMITASRILDRCMALGARPAEPGEFTKRAVLHGKMDLSQAEAVAKLIESKSVDAARILARQLKGELKEFVDTLRDALIEILAYIEVNIDYAEEDLPESLQKQIVQKLEAIDRKIRETLQVSKSREGLIEGFRVAIVGKPNVGKSSLLNALLRYDRAIISEIAGTTRDTIEEEIRIGTHLVRIVDTAGIRQSADTIEQIGIERSMQAAESADVVIALFDGSRPLESDDREIIGLLEKYRSEKKIIVAINKSDLPQQIDPGLLEPFAPVSVSARAGAPVLIEKLETVLSRSEAADETLLISKRQVDAAQKTDEAINRAFEFLESGELELFAYEINEAITAIASITHAFERDEILDKMFGSFCL